MDKGQIHRQTEAEIIQEPATELLFAEFSMSPIETGSKTRPETGPETGPKTGPETGPKTGPKTGSETNDEPRHGPRCETRSVAKPGSRPGSRSETGSESSSDKALTEQYSLLDSALVWSAEPPADGQISEQKVQDQAQPRDLREQELRQKSRSRTSRASTADGRQRAVQHFARAQQLAKQMRRSKDSAESHKTGQAICQHLLASLRAQQQLEQQAQRL